MDSIRMDLILSKDSPTHAIFIFATLFKCDWTLYYENFLEAHIVNFISQLKIGFGSTFCFSGNFSGIWKTSSNYCLKNIR